MLSTNDGPVGLDLPHDASASRETRRFRLVPQPHPASGTKYLHCSQLTRRHCCVRLHPHLHPADTSSVSRRCSRLVLSADSEWPVETCGVFEGYASIQARRSRWVTCCTGPSDTRLTSGHLTESYAKAMIDSDLEARLARSSHAIPLHRWMHAVFGGLYAR